MRDEHRDSTKLKTALGVQEERKNTYGKPNRLLLWRTAQTLARPTIRERDLASTHPELAETLHEFAILRQVQGKYDEARSLYERALSARTQTLGLEHSDTIDTRKHLAALLRDLGRTEEAAALETMQPEQEKTGKE